MKGFFSVLGFLAALPIACGGGDDADDDDTRIPEIDCANANVPNYSEVRAFQVCKNCHGSDVEGVDRNGAPASINLDTYDGAKSATDSESRAELLVLQVASGKMPPPGSGYSVTESEKEELYTWVECGRPE